MKTMKINNSLSLGVERYEKRVRLVVLAEKEELACRKETFTNLRRFIESKQAHAFKGRLQLFKKSGIINVEVKRKKLGSVSTKSFEKCLSALSNI